MTDTQIDQLTEQIIGCGIEVHRTLGAGLLESVYRECLMIELRGTPQNAIAERINGILKDEFDLDAEFINVNHVQTAVAKAVEVYNTKRPHWSLGLRTPQEMYELAA